MIENEYDLLYRRTDLVEPAVSTTSIAHWEFFGPSRVAECRLKNGLAGTHLNNARNRTAIQPGDSVPGWGDDSSNRLGYDGAARPITKRFVSSTLAGGGGYADATSLVGFTTRYDRASNKFYERHLHAESRSHLYEPFESGIPQGGYDSLDRLRQYQRGVLSSTGGDDDAGGGSITTPMNLPNADTSRGYDLDGLGNWKKTSFDPGTQLHLKLGEGSGSTAADSSGYNRDGTFQNRTLWVPGPSAGWHCRIGSVRWPVACALVSPQFVMRWQPKSFTRNIPSISAVRCRRSGGYSVDVGSYLAPSANCCRRSARQPARSTTDRLYRAYSSAR